MTPSKNKNDIDFFMGANSPNGFYSFYGELTSPKEAVRRFLIKGGAGTGKSGLMKKVAERFLEKDKLVELIHCSSDPTSLDGIILHTAKCSIVDATPPHVIEPTYPGGFETVINLCEYFNEDELEARLLKTVEYQTANNDCHKKCRNFLKCADILLKDNALYVESCTDFSKVAKLAQRICQTEFKTALYKKPVQYKRLLSAITNQGVVTYTNTAAKLANRIYLIKDEYGVSSNALLQYIRNYGISKGYDMFVCTCPLTPEEKVEHIFIPELELGFVTQSRYNDFSNIEPYRVINFTRFTDMEKLHLKKQYLSFNRKAALELIDSAVDVLKQAKVIHDKLEEQYMGCVDFSMVNMKTEEVIKKIEKRYAK